MPSDLHYLSLGDVARRIRSRELSSVEVTREILDRIDKLDGKLKSYAIVTSESALKQAQQLDAETTSGRSLGPLHGVPIAVKDLCNTAGVATAAGMPLHAKHIPDKDATVVARLKQAGAVILGKLQMTEGAYGLHHPLIEPPKNPWNPAYWTGASSSGSAAATAAGLCFGSLGSDTGGAVRPPPPPPPPPGAQAAPGGARPAGGLLPAASP